MGVEAAVEKKSLTLSRTIARRSPIVFIEKVCWLVAASGALWSETRRLHETKKNKSVEPAFVIFLGATSLAVGVGALLPLRCFGSRRC